MTDKKQEIVGKVRQMYQQYGIKSVTMDDVVREVGISKKTLYQFFSDKSELITEVLSCESSLRYSEHREAVKGASNAIEEMLGHYDFQMKMIREHNPSMIYDLKKYYPEIHNKFLEAKRKGIYEGILANLKRGKAEGVYREELNEEIIARLNLMRVEAFIQSGIFNHDEIMAPDFFREMLTYHIYGIVNKQGRKILEENIDKLK